MIGLDTNILAIAQPIFGVPEVGTILLVRHQQT